MPAVDAGRGSTQREVVNLVRPEGAAISDVPLCSGSASSRFIAGLPFASGSRRFAEAF